MIIVILLNQLDLSVTPNIIIALVKSISCRHQLQQISGYFHSFCLFNHKNSLLSFTFPFIRILIDQLLTRKEQVKKHSSLITEMFLPYSISIAGLLREFNPLCHQMVFTVDSFESIVRSAARKIGSLCSDNFSH